MYDYNDIYKYNVKCKHYPNGTLKYIVFNRPVFNPDKVGDLERNTRYFDFNAGFSCDGFRARVLNEKARLAPKFLLIDTDVEPGEFDGYPHKDGGFVQWVCFEDGLSDLVYKLHSRDWALVPVPFVVSPSDGFYIDGQWYMYVERGTALYDEHHVRERSDSVKRATEKIFDIAVANADEWEYMITFTLSDKKISRYDVDEINKKLKIWLNNMVKRKGLKYIICPEYHKNGAVHFHGLVNGALTMESSGTYSCPNRKKPVKLVTLKRLGFDVDDETVREVFNVTDYPYGWSTAVKLDENKLNVCKYITKYITKDNMKVMGNFYYAGGKLARELDIEFFNLPFAEADGEALSVPGAGGLQVKYIQMGVF